ncbi:hypothetical protein P8452_46770 [Trifolium repens]|nr:hypothetical protein P8452_46770 [Trifolium repens]
MMDQVKKLYNEMKEKGVYLDQIAYTTLIAAFCSTGEMILAQAFFDEMLREGYSPNAQKAATGLSRKVLRLKSGAIR